MAKAINYPLSVFAGTPATMQARVLVSTGAVATAANVQSITVTVTNSQGTTTYSGSVTVATAMSVLTVDARWTADPIGRNFLDVIPGTAWETPGWYQVLYEFTDSAGQVFPLCWQGAVAGVA
jgi:hypothetical protein